MSELSVGVLGLGAMGLPLARRLLDGGVAVRGVDTAPARIESAAALGIAAHRDAASLAGCRVIIVTVADAHDLQSLATSQLFESAHVEVVCVLSTVGADAVRDFEQVMLAREIGVVDCPVTGGVPGAESGSLTIFAAGAPRDVSAAAGALSRLGTIANCGDRVGDGQLVKMVNQVLAASHVVIAAEAIALAERLGLDPDVTLALLSTGAGGSWMLRDRGPRMLIPRDRRQVKTHLSILAKDAQLALQTASREGLDVAVLAAVAHQWSAAIEMGWASADDSSVIDLYR